MAFVYFDKPVINLDENRTNPYEVKRYYLDPVLKSNLDLMKIAVVSDWDFVICVDGIERGGKSIFAQQIGYYLDPTLNPSRIVFSPQEFERACINAEKYQVVIYDEAITGAEIKDTMGDLSKALMKMLAQIGQKNLFIIIVLPTYMDLTRYIALWRARIVFNVYVKGYKDRGYFRAFKTKKNFIYTAYRKWYFYPDKMIDFKGRFTRVCCIDEIEYRKKKAEALKPIEDKNKPIAIIETRKPLIINYTPKNEVKPKKTK